MRNSAPLPMEEEVPDASGKPKDFMELGANLTLVIKVHDGVIRTRVTEESRIEGVILLLKSQTIGNTLYSAAEALEPKKKIGEYQRFIYLAEASNMAHEVELEFK